MLPPATHRHISHTPHACTIVHAHMCILRHGAQHAGVFLHVWAPPSPGHMGARVAGWAGRGLPVHAHLDNGPLLLSWHKAPLTFACRPQGQGRTCGGGGGVVSEGAASSGIFQIQARRLQRCLWRGNGGAPRASTSLAWGEEELEGEGRQLVPSGASAVSASRRPQQSPALSSLRWHSALPAGPTGGHLTLWARWPLSPLPHSVPVPGTPSEGPPSHPPESMVSSLGKRP